MMYDFTTDFSGTFRCEVADEESAKILANEYFEKEFKKYDLPFPSGRWVVANEGENAEGAVSYIRYRYETPLFILSFSDISYPVIGVFSSKEKAEEALTSSMNTDKRLYPNHPLRYGQRRDHYSIDERYLDDVE